MAFTNTLSDTVSRLRNGQIAKKDSVIVLYSKFNLKVLDVLTNEGYIRGYEVIQNESITLKIKRIKVFLKYHQKTPIPLEMKIISKPGRRSYIDLAALWSNPYMQMPGIIILSTNKGIMTNKEARKQRVGGEILLKIK